jgi:hypothetical protein
MMPPRLDDLLPLVAYHLTRRWVQFEIYYGNPVHVDGGVVNGCTRKDKTGRAVVTLQAGRSGKAFFETVCHELAHVNKHFDDLPTVEATAYQALTYSIVKSDYTPAVREIIDNREETAEASAGRWYRFAMDRVADWRSNDPIPCLKALLTIPEGEI